MSLLLDALRRAGASRGDEVVEAVPERPRAPAASSDAGAAEGGPADIPALDVEPLSEEGRAGGQERGARPSGSARAEAVFRGGASGRPALRAAGAGVLGAILVGAALVGGAWYYQETTRSEVDRELVRYTPEPAPAEPAGEGTAAAGGSGIDAGSNGAEGAAKAATNEGAGAQAAPTATASAGDAPTGGAAPESGGSTTGGAGAAEAAGAAGASGATAKATGKGGSGAAPGASGAAGGTDAGAGGGDTHGGGAESDRVAEADASPARDAAAASPDASDRSAKPAGSGGGDAGGRQQPMVRASESGGRLGEALRAGYRALRSGDLAAARRHYRRALERAPANRDARLGAAAVAQRRGEAALAAEHYRRVLKDHPRDPYARAGLASLEGAREPRRSESELKGLLKDDPDAHALRFSLGNLYAGEGRWAEAQSAYFEALRAAPREADYAFNLAVALDQLGQREAAVSYYERAIALVGDGAASFPVAAARRRLERLKP